MRSIARGIVVHDGRLLVIRRNNHGKHYVVLPGGGVDPGETTEQAAAREILEETSIVATVDRLAYTWTDDFGSHSCYVCTYVSGEPQVQENTNEAADNAAGLNLFSAEWLPVDQLADEKLLPESLQQELITAFSSSFPTQPKSI
jgi:8-oxo-dGTP pyrophosphatase MutT (NUDIX family)